MTGPLPRAKAAGHAIAAGIMAGNRFLPRALGTGTWP